MKDWNNFGDNNSIDSMFEYNGDQVPENNENEITDAQSGDDPKRKDERLKNYRSAKYSDAEIERIEMIKQAIATDNDSKALRWCLEKVWDMYGEQIEKVAQMRSQIGTL